MELREAIQTVQQRTQGRERFRASLSERRAREVVGYDALFDELSAWLRPLVAEGKLQTARKTVTVFDATLGELSINALSVRLLPCVGIEVVLAPTGVASATIRNEIKLRRSDSGARAEDYFIFKIIADGEDAPWRIARRTKNPGRPKVLALQSFEEAICAQLLG
jgi:hypothetical protein